jgi:hypothetical protein
MHQQLQNSVRHPKKTFATISGDKADLMFGYGRLGLNGIPGCGGRSLKLGSVCVVPRRTTQMHMEKVGPQFLSLRQLGQSRIFSSRDCWQLSPVLAAISNLSSGLLIGRGGLFFSDWLISLRSSGLRGLSTVLEIRVFREAYEL